MRVVIVGAGPAGAALALLLARWGADVRLVEREPSPGGAFRGEGLMPLGLDALLQMELFPVLARIPGHVVDSWRIWIDGQEVFRIPEPIDELGDRAFRVVFTAALLDGILAEAARYPNVAYHPATRFVGVVRNDAGRVVGARTVHGDEPTEWPADLLVGCDGRGSSVRTHAGLPLETSPENYTCCGSRRRPRPSRRRAATSTSWCAPATTRWSPTGRGTTGCSAE